jgi:hypothetical protein
MDETGCSDWADRPREIRVVVPAQCPEASLAVPVDRNSKRASMAVCIAADGSCMRPFVVVHRTRVERDFVYWRYDEWRVMIYTQPSAFMTRPLFLEWAKREFFPEVERRRRKHDYEGPAIMLLDGLVCHRDREFLQRCREGQIVVLTFPPHSSDQLQPLDLLTFGLLKRRFSSSRFDRCHSPQSNKIIRMLGALEWACSPHLVVQAFMSLCLVSTEADPRDPNRGALLSLELDRDLARSVRLGPLEPEASHIALFPGDARMRAWLLDGTLGGFEADPGPLPEDQRAPDGPDD